MCCFSFLITYILTLPGFLFLTVFLTKCIPAFSPSRVITAVPNSLCSLFKVCCCEEEVALCLLYSLPLRKSTCSSRADICSDLRRGWQCSCKLLDGHISSFAFVHRTTFSNLGCVSPFCPVDPFQIFA